MTLTRPELETDYTLSRSDIAHFAAHGFVKLKNVLSPDTIAAYEPEITGKVIELNTQDLPLDERDTYGKAFLQVMNLWQDSERVLESCRRRGWPGSRRSCWVCSRSGCTTTRRSTRSPAVASRRGTRISTTGRSRRTGA